MPDFRAAMDGAPAAPLCTHTLCTHNCGLQKNLEAVHTLSHRRTHTSTPPFFLSYLSAFAEGKKWTPELDSVLGEVGSTGSSQLEWAALKPLLAAKLEAVCAEYYVSVQDLQEPYEEVLKRLLALLAEFPNAPFTVQRLCELLLDPHRIYASSTRKVTQHRARKQAAPPATARPLRRLRRLGPHAPRPRLALTHSPSGSAPVLPASARAQVTSALEKLLTVSSTVPTMVLAQPKPGSYQAASEAPLASLVGGDAEAMDVEN